MVKKISVLAGIVTLMVACFFIGKSIGNDAGEKAGYDKGYEAGYLECRDTAITFQDMEVYGSASCNSYTVNCDLNLDYAYVIYDESLGAYRFEYNVQEFHGKVLGNEDGGIEIYFDEHELGYDRNTNF